MATRSCIGIEDKDGTIRSVYCHWDGYLEHVGQVLHKHYQFREIVEFLIQQGSMSSLDNNIEGCEFYSRKDGSKPDIDLHNSVKEFVKAADSLNTEFAYLFDKEDTWNCFKAPYFAKHKLSDLIK